MDKRINGTIVSVTRVTPFDKLVFVNGKFGIAYEYAIKVKYSVNGKDYFKRRYWGYCDSESVPWIGSTLPVMYSEKNPKIAQVRIPKDLNIQIPSIVFTFVFLGFALIFIGFLSVMLNYNKMTKISYDDLSYYEFTVEEINREDTFFGDSYNIVVSETDKTIRISNLFAKPQLDKIDWYIIINVSNKFTPVASKQHPLLFSEKCLQKHFFRFLDKIKRLKYYFF